MCSVLVEQSEQRDALRDHIKQKGIETRPLFYPVHTMPIYDEKYERHKVAENLGWRGMNLPSYPGLSQKDVSYIVEAILNYFSK
jgi:perosamine synthetase